MALLLAMAANVGVSTMVSSFRLTFTGFLDQRLSAELYVQRPRRGGGGADRGAGRRAGARCCRSCRWSATSPACPGELYARGTIRPTPRTGAFSPRSPTSGTRLAAGEGVLVNEQLARRAGLSLGDPLDGGGRRAPAGDRHSRRLRQPDRAGRDHGGTVPPPATPRWSALRFGLRVPPDRVAALADRAGRGRHPARRH